MYPILLQLGDFYLPSWHAFYALAGLVGWYLLQRLRPILLPEVRSSAIDNLFLLSYALGYGGARLFSLVHEGEYLRADFSWWRAPFELGSMTLYGGVIAVSVFVIIYTRIKKVPFLGLADLFLIPALTAIGVGRIGCFLNGDDYGQVASPGSPWPLAVVFPNLNDGLSRYSVQLWETAFCFVLSIYLLMRVQKKADMRGSISDIGIISYSVGRFFLEFFRGDDRGIFLSPLLSPAQWLSIIFISLWATFRFLAGQKGAREG